MNLFSSFSFNLDFFLSSSFLLSIDITSIMCIINHCPSTLHLILTLLLILFLFLTALGRVRESERTHHSSPSVIGFERKFRNDSCIPSFDSSESRPYGYAETTMVHDRWKSRLDSSESDSNSIFTFSLHF